MDVFSLTVDAMLMMFLLIVAGFFLQKLNVLPEGSDIAMARLETYLLVPALYFYTWSSNCTISTFKENTNLILWGLITTIAGILLSQPLCRLFVPRIKQSTELAYQREIYKYAMAFSNSGFMGNFIVLGIWGSEGLFQYSMFTLAMSFFAASWGVCILIPKTQKPSFGLIMKNFFSPPTVSLLLGCVVGLFDLAKYIPDFFMRAVSNAADCMGPVSMVLSGFVIGSYHLKELVTKKKIYIASLTRLILIPAAFMLAFHALNVGKQIMTWALIAYATPIGLYTIVCPATYGADTKTGASMTLLSSTLSVITIPLMYFLFIVLL